MKKTEGMHHFVECGLENVYIENCVLFVCDTCKKVVPLLPDAELVMPYITERLIQKSGRLNSDEILFLRKAAGLKAEELAKMLGVDRVSVSRWENARSKIEGLFDLRLRKLVLERVLGPERREAARLRNDRLLESSYNGNIVNEMMTVKLPPAFLIAGMAELEQTG
jgi:DNA-binding transcriptional regulator YiaG